MVSDRWDNRTHLIAGLTPTLSRRPFYLVERFFVVTENRGKGIHTPYSTVLLLQGPFKTCKVRIKANEYLGTLAK